MSPLLIILLVLFVSLIVLVPLIERFGPKLNSEEMSGLRRWLLPLMILMVVVNALGYFFF